MVKAETCSIIVHHCTALLWLSAPFLSSDDSAWPIWQQRCWPGEGSGGERGLCEAAVSSVVVSAVVVWLLVVVILNAVNKTHCLCCLVQVKTFCHSAKCAQQGANWLRAPACWGLATASYRSVFRDMSASVFKTLIAGNRCIRLIWTRSYKVHLSGAKEI